MSVRDTLVATYGEIAEFLAEIKLENLDATPHGEEMKKPLAFKII